MEKQWRFLEKKDLAIVNTLSEELKIPQNFAQILDSRGLRSFEDSKKFFNPRIEDLHDAFLMKNMKEAVERVLIAIDNNQKILVYGDYDVDGTTSVAMMFSFLSSYSKHVQFYIPDRYKEGYGVSEQGIDYAISSNVSLIITLDCGIKAVPLIAKAKENDVDVIVCDHHLPGAELPEAIILDPKQEDCHYPFDELSGCGVGFKLIQAILSNKDEDPSLAFEYLDLLAISIAADIVPMVGENRVLATLGLEKINENPSLGIHYMIDNHKNKGRLSITDVVFGIAPKINAAGRIKSAETAVNLLLADHPGVANDLFQQITRENDERKDLDKSITQEALSQVVTKKEERNCSTLVYDENWHKGVVGIVASRLIEKYYRPTIVLTKSGDKWAGSARSVHDYSVYDAIAACSDHLLQFGGHKYAAGLTIKEDNIENFKSSFEKYVANTISENQKKPVIDIDAELVFMDLKPELNQSFPKFYRLIKRMAPFGPLNMKPTFIVRDVIAKEIRMVGDNHLKLKLTQEMTSVSVDAIGFNLGAFKDEITDQPFHIVFTIEENNWKNRTTLQLNVKDIKIGQLEL